MNLNLEGYETGLTGVTKFLTKNDEDNCKDCIAERWEEAKTLDWHSRVK
jgi:hypothetical protein